MNFVELFYYVNVIDKLKLLYKIIITINDEIIPVTTVKL